MQHYYSEWEPYAAEWLENLGQAGLIPAGRVDQRDVQEVRADDLEGYGVCHFFAGLGGWAYALRLAGWDPARPVWTASLPCQPFSAAGKQKGEEDERHLWPVFFRLVCQRQPPVIFGEQVNSDDGYRWLAGIRHDLEAEGYAVGCADLPACSQAAPHIRGRLFWVAVRLPDTGSGLLWNGGRGATVSEEGGHKGANGERQRVWPDAGADGAADVRLSDEPVGDGAECGGVDDGDSKRRLSGGIDSGQPQEPKSVNPGVSGGSLRAWDRFGIVQCRDGKPRRIPESVVQCLADGLPAGMDGLPAEAGYPLAAVAGGIPGRRGALRAFGNAIVPQVAAAFIRVYLEAEQEDGHRWTVSR